MTSPTRQQIINAHEALNSLLKLASGTSTASAIFNWETVRAAFPPKPQPTMSDVEWDDELHYLAEAELAGWGKVTMLWASTIGNISVIGDGLIKDVRAEDLTPTGKRYRLQEVQDD
ncbi:hypothetical protein QP999_02980 [Corynebacterium sp. MSK004]|uniref:hypothetical protein n=1 Tax=Corynebacterium sp. MSK004 TaxID=3050186 RepID=UPI00254F0E76|nr:hypothetical protein [Corynebacterium sp. MSK004]MDK8896906.1 hypothetical protein [Corynebacterium sp. MSK004]